MKETLTMSEEEYQQVQPSLIEDLIHRVRRVEDADVKSRVDRLEIMMETFQRDLHDMSAEQRRFDAKTEESFRDLSASIHELGNQVGRVMNKVAVWSGGILVGGGILTVFFTKTDILQQMLGG